MLWGVFSEYHDVLSLCLNSSPISAEADIFHIFLSFPSYLDSWPKVVFYSWRKGNINWISGCYFADDCVPNQSFFLLVQPIKFRYLLPSLIRLPYFIRLSKSWIASPLNRSKFCFPWSQFAPITEMLASATHHGCLSVSSYWNLRQENMYQPWRQVNINWT